MRPFEPMTWNELPESAKAVFPKDAAPATKMVAARSLLPMGTRDLISVLYLLAADEDRRVRTAARQSLTTFPREMLSTALADDLSSKILNWYAHRALPDARLYETITLNRATEDETVARLARRRGEETLLTIIANHQERLMRSPATVKALLDNSATPLAIAQQVREFVERSSGQTIDEFLADVQVEPEAAPETVEASEATETPPQPETMETTPPSPAESPVAAESAAQPVKEKQPSILDAYRFMEEEEIPMNFDLDKLQKEIFSTEDNFASEFLVDPETELSAQQRTSLANRIRKMRVIEKMALAMKGNIEARQILIKNANKMIQECVLRNPRITFEEVIKVTKDKSMREELIRDIAYNRDWVKNYQIAHHLCYNPKTPMTQALKFLERLTLKDLSGLAKSKQVPGMLAVQARKMHQFKSKHR